MDDEKSRFRIHFRHDKREGDALRNEDDDWHYINGLWFEPLNDSAWIDIITDEAFKNTLDY